MTVVFELLKGRANLLTPPDLHPLKLTKCVFRNLGGKISLAISARSVMYGLEILFLKWKRGKISGARFLKKRYSKKLLLHRDSWNISFSL